MIIIPMAGSSSRFAVRGYDTPKYMLKAHGKTLFSHAVSSFSRYFGSTEFLFIYRNVNDTLQFIQEQCREIGVSRFRCAALATLTSGQAETVALGLSQAQVSSEEPITIFNIDTFRPGFTFPSWPDEKAIAGYLEVFVGSGANWSYVRPRRGAPGFVAEVREKVEISELCSTGLYAFSSAGMFFRAFRNYADEVSRFDRSAELYVAPMYNVLISMGLEVRYYVVDRKNVVFCGVPDEYERFCGQCVAE